MCPTWDFPTAMLEMENSASTLMGFVSVPQSSNYIHHIAQEIIPRYFPKGEGDLCSTRTYISIPDLFISPLLFFNNHRPETACLLHGKTVWLCSCEKTGRAGEQPRCSSESRSSQAEAHTEKAHSVCFHSCGILEDEELL